MTQKNFFNNRIRQVLAFCTAFAVIGSNLSVPLKPATAQAADSSKYVLISNESVNEKVSESTGQLSNIQANSKTSSQLQKGSYKTDAVLPFTPTVAQRKQNRLGASIPSAKQYAIGAKRSFYVNDFTTGKYTTISAQLYSIGTHSEIWVADSKMTKTEAQKMADEFDQNIYSTVSTNFGKESDVDNNGKVDILCYDIQDGYDGSGGFTAGYFGGADLYKIANSNQSEMIYMDTYPAMTTDDEPSTIDATLGFETVVHEFQHMVNYNQSVFVENSESMPTWLDEGLAMAAEHLYHGVVKDRISYYNSSSFIRAGHSLLNWGGDTLSNYSLSYLFLQYFRIQAKQGNAIYKELYTLKANSYLDVETLIHKYIDSKMSFGQFMTNFRAALLLKETTGLHGFLGETGFSELKTPLYTGTSTKLTGGGAIVKAVGSTGFSIPATHGSNITYTLLDTAPVAAPTLTLNHQTLDLITSQTSQLTATLSDGSTPSLTWKSSNTTVASVSTTGLVTAGLLAGTTTITVSNQDGTSIASCTVTVTKPTAGIFLNTTEITLHPGSSDETYQLISTILPKESANTEVVWTSSDDSIATVSDQGLVTGISSGDAEITVETEDGVYQATCVVHVEDSVIAVTGVSLDMDQMEGLYPLESFTLEATVTPSDATDPSLIWTSSDEDIATITQDGEVTAVAPGTTILTVRTVDGDYTAQCKLTVESSQEEIHITYVQYDGTKMQETLLAVLGENIFGKLLSPKTRTGYTFSGWFTAKTGGKQITANTVITSAAPLVLYARYVAKKYTVTYVLNGGRNTIKNKTTYTYGIGLPLYSPTKAKKRFVNWYKTKKFLKNTQITSISKTMSGNLTLYAKWK